MNYKRANLPIPVLPINFFRIPFPLKVYITIYILINYKDFKRGFSPPKFNWKNWNWKIYVIHYLFP